MLLFFLSFAVVSLAILGMAAGALLGRRPLQGSCGGASVVKACPLCRSSEE